MFTHKEVKIVAGGLLVVCILKKKKVPRHWTRATGVDTELGLDLRQLSYGKNHQGPSKAITDKSVGEIIRLVEWLDEIRSLSKMIFCTLGTGKS
jgi:hypothetical protein